MNAGRQRFSEFPKRYSFAKANGGLPTSLSDCSDS